MQEATGPSSLARRRVRPPSSRPFRASPAVIGAPPAPTIGSRHDDRRALAPDGAPARTYHRAWEAEERAGRRALLAFVQGPNEQTERARSCAPKRRSKI